MGFFLTLAISRPGITTYCWESGSGMIVSRVPGGCNYARPTYSHFSILSCYLLGIGGSPAPNHTFCCDFSPIPILFGINNNSRAVPVSDEKFITSATVGLITGSVIVDEDDGIRPAAKMSPRRTVGRMGSDPC